MYNIGSHIWSCHTFDREGERKEWQNQTLYIVYLSGGKSYCFISFGGVDQCNTIDITIKYGLVLTVRYIDNAYMWY